MPRPREFDEDEVLQKALDVFRARGFDGATLVELEAATGLGRGSLYGAFGDKRSLFLKALARYCDTALQHRLEALEGPDAGRAEIVALTLGSAGAVLATKDRVLRLASPKVETRSAVGAGDSFVGAMVWALADGRPLEDAFAYGIAAGAATAMTAGTELCRRADVQRLFETIKAGPPDQGAASSPS